MLVKNTKQYLHVIAISGARRQRKRLVLQATQASKRCRIEPVIIGNHHRKRLRDDFSVSQQRAVGRVSFKGNVRAISQQVFFYLKTALLGEFNAHIRVLLSERDDQIGQNRIRDRAGVADVEHPGLAPGNLPPLPVNVLNVRQQPLPFLRHKPPGTRQLDPAFAAVEQQKLQFSF